MKRFIQLMSAVFLFTAVSSIAQDNDDATGLPGDHFSLEGALDLFKKSSSLEEFEKKLNTEGNHVNNLDLNGDGDIDYVKVIDNMKEDVHAITLQVAVSDKENQDIAVIELEKDGPASAVVQIVGDEDIYGESLIVEPTSGDEDHEMKKKGPYMMLDDDAVIVNVWLWPSVGFVYAPVYRPWVSPFHWAFYPTWWRPWHPLAWSVFHPFRVGFRMGYAIAPVHRVIRAHRVYTPVRVTSVTVTTHNKVARDNYRVTHKRTTVDIQKGNHEIHATHSSTEIKGRHGDTKIKTSHTKVRTRNR